jgi:hypothetical protein
MAAVRGWSSQPGHKKSSEIVPSLSFEERRKLLTFEQLCKKPEDCEAPLGCLGGFQDDKALCLDSDCTSDLQCEEGFACHALRTLDRRRFIRTCVPAGKRVEGQACDKGLVLVDWACARGLRCHGFCGRSCIPGVPLMCPTGSFCHDSIDGASCQPTCEETGCPQGQQCIVMGEGLSICGLVLGQQCQQHPCAEGQECDLGYPGILEGRNPVAVSMECVQRCGDGKPPCPADAVCFSGTCRQSCDPTVANVCGPDRRCVASEHEAKGICRLDTGG